MTNPFDHILPELKKKARQEAEARRLAEKQAALKRQQLFADHISKVTPYGKIAMEVLKDLQQAVYPVGIVGTSDYRPDEEPKWSIFCIRPRDISLSSLPWDLSSCGQLLEPARSQILIDVILEFGEDQMPKGFICRRYDPTNTEPFVIAESRADLSKSSLVNAIMQLYPSGT